MFYAVEIEVTGLSIPGEDGPIIGFFTWRNTFAGSEEQAKTRAVKRFSKEAKFRKLKDITRSQTENGEVVISVISCEIISFKFWLMTRKMGFACYGESDSDATDPNDDR